MALLIPSDTFLAAYLFASLHLYPQVYQSTRLVAVMVFEQDYHGTIGLFSQHPFISSILLLLLLSYVLARSLMPKVDPAEPPVISHPVPFLGHLIGIMASGMKYFVDIG